VQTTAFEPAGSQVSGRLIRGFTARLDAPHPVPLARSARRGETPRRFSPHSFCGAVAKNNRLYRFFTFARPAFIGRRSVAAVASLAALMLGGTRLSASLAPCALGGDRLATTVCGQTPLAVVTNRHANWRISSLISHHSSLPFGLRRRVTVARPKCAKLSHFVKNLPSSRPGNGSWHALCFIRGELKRKFQQGRNRL